MKLTFLELAEKVIREENIPLSPLEIWEFAKNKGYDKLVGSKGKTPAATIGAQIYIDIRDNKGSRFIKANSRPTRFFLNDIPQFIHSVTEEEVLEAVGKLQEEPNYLEKDLHPVLAYFANLYLKVFVKTISHEKSSKKSFGEWVHPDVVGFYYPEWKEELIDLSALIGDSSIKLFSFELKKHLNLGNLRESFFQTVSNSSWANESYLVAANISEEEDFLDELKRLCSSFGIGIISLNVDDPDSSEVFITARIRESLDWDMMNKLASMSNDFKNFLKGIKIDISSKEPRKERYDKVLSKEELIKRFQ